MVMPYHGNGMRLHMVAFVIWCCRGRGIKRAAILSEQQLFLALEGFGGTKLTLDLAALRFVAMVSLVFCRG